MKILQAIVTSASETLDGRQGFGLVRCSRILPPLIRQEASDLGYSSDAGGKAIYSLRSCLVAESSWLIMNRTVPDVDYTGRTSHISHTIAVREDELRAFLLSINEGVASVFEFMERFEWKSTWEGEPTWIEETEDLEASGLEGFRSSLASTVTPLDPHGLLCFDYSETNSTKPRRAAWSFAGASPEEMLETFHRAWLCLDPWRGSCKRGGILGEPSVTLRDSWACSFTTNLRHGRPDFYQWVALSAESPTIPNRVVIDPAEWNAMSYDAVKERIGSELGSLLVDRCVQGPEEWANARLIDKLKNLEKDYEEKARIRVKEAHDDMLALIETLRSKVDSSRQHILTFEREGYWSYDEKAEAEVSELRGKLSGQQQQSLHDIKTERGEYEVEVRKVLELLPPGLAEESGFEITVKDGFPSLTAEFEKWVECYRDDRRIARTCNFLKEYHIAHDEKCKQVNALKEQAKNLRNDISSRDQKINELERMKSALEAPKASSASAGKRKNKPNANSGKLMGWHATALAGVSLLIMLATAWYVISRADEKTEKKTDSISFQESLEKAAGNPGKSEGVNGSDDRNTGSQPSAPVLEAKPKGNPAPESEREPNEVGPLQTPENEGGQKAKEANAPSASTEVSPVLEQPKRTEEKPAVDDKSKEGSDGN